MTQEEITLEKISLLQSEKANLLKKSEFINPSNDKKIYSSQSLSEKDNTSGSTPSDIISILKTIMETTKSYIDEVKKYPFVEGSKSQEESSIIKISPHKDNSKANIVSGATISNIERYIPDSVVSHGIDYMKFSVYADFYIEAMHSISVTKINTRTRGKEVYIINGSGGEVTIFGKDINIDDLFIISVATKEDMPSSSISLDGFASVITRSGGSDYDKTIPFSSSRNPQPFTSGNLIMGSNFAWCATSIGETKLELNSSASSVDITKNLSLGALFTPRSKIISISGNGETSGISSMNLAVGVKTGAFDPFNSFSYDVSQQRTSSNKALMNNIIGIDTILKDAINDL